MQQFYSILFFLSLTVFGIACENDLKQVQALEDDSYDVNKEYIKGVELIYSELGKVKVKLTAPLMIRHKKGEAKLEFPSGIDLQFFNDKLQVTSNLSANYAEKMENRQEVTVRDSVVIFNQKGEKLMTDELIWDERIEKIRSDKEVHIITMRDTIRGKGFEANQDFSQYKIYKTTGRTRVKRGKFE